MLELFHKLRLGPRPRPCPACGHRPGEPRRMSSEREIGRFFDGLARGVDRGPLVPASRMGKGEATTPPRLKDATTYLNRHAVAPLG